jgi:hypothetical protein
VCISYVLAGFVMASVINASANDDDGWYYDVSRGRVVRGRRGSSLDLMGPYPDEATAEQALEIARNRNKAADADDDAWND